MACPPRPSSWDRSAVGCWPRFRLIVAYAGFFIGSLAVLWFICAQVALGPDQPVATGSTATLRRTQGPQRCRANSAPSATSNLAVQSTRFFASRQPALIGWQVPLPIV
jgi:hypothetical protein